MTSHTLHTLHPLLVFSPLHTATVYFPIHFPFLALSYSSLSLRKDYRYLPSGGHVILNDDGANHVFSVEWFILHLVTAWKRQLLASPKLDCSRSDADLCFPVRSKLSGD
jgi:hypothetical protein